MKATIKDLLQGLPALQKLYNQDLPLTSSYKLSELAGQVPQKLAFFAERQDGIRAMGKDGQKQLDELLAMSAGLEDIPRLRLPMSDNILLSASDLERLEAFIDFEVADEAG